MKQLCLAILFSCAILAWGVGAHAQDPGPWYQTLPGAELPDVAYPNGAYSQAFSWEGRPLSNYTTNVVDLGDGNSGLQMVNPGGGWACWFMWPEGTTPVANLPQNTLATRFRIDSIESGARMDLLHVKPRSYGRPNVPLGIGVKDNHFWLLQYPCGTAREQFLLDLGPVEVGKWNTAYLASVSPPVWPDAPVATCYWNGVKVYDHNFAGELTNLTRYSATECGFGVGVQVGGGPAVITFDWVADNFYVIDPPYKTALADTKTELDGTSVYIDHAVVTNISNGEDGYPFCFNMQSADGALGIRVISNTYVYLGDDVSVQGVLSTIEGERVMITGSVPESVIVNSPGEALKPVALSNKCCAGGALGKQAAVADNALASPIKMSSGANNVGLLTSIFGKVTAVQATGTYAGSFYVDDGSGLQDGSGNTGVRCSPPSEYFDATDMPVVGDYILVKGAVGVKQINGNNARYFWTWSWEKLFP